MPLSFAVAILVSLVTVDSNADGRFEEMQHRILFGRGRASTVQGAE